MSRGEGGTYPMIHVMYLPPSPPNTMTDACVYRPQLRLRAIKMDFEFLHKWFKSLNVVTQAVMAEGKQNAVAVGYTKMSTEKM